jgi:hypothetical protein
MAISSHSHLRENPCICTNSNPIIGSPQSCQLETSQAHTHPPPQYPNIVYAVQHYHLHANININNSAAIITPSRPKQVPSYQTQGVTPLLRAIKQEPEASIEFPPMQTPMFPSTSVSTTSSRNGNAGNGRSSGKID